MGLYEDLDRRHAPCPTGDPFVVGCLFATGVGVSWLIGAGIWLYTSFDLFAPTRNSWLLWTPPVAFVAVVLGVRLLCVRAELRETAMAGKCRQCGYDLRATPDRCPECGTVPVGERA